MRGKATGPGRPAWMVMLKKDERTEKRRARLPGKCRAVVRIANDIDA